jgi:16S rRNA (cytosine967-C5)-methyltransferase
VPGLAARRGALALVGAVLDRGAMLDEAGLEGAGLEASPAGRAEARGLADLTLRRLGQIDDALGRFVQRMPKPPVSHALRLMAAELMFGGTAPHAAVDMGVRLVKGARGAAKFSGMVNAVGRRLAGEGAAVAAAQDAGRLCLPGWLGRRLAADWGKDAARAMAAAHLVPAPHDLTARDLAEAEALAADLGADLLPTGTVRLRDRPQISTLPGFAEGRWWAQDAAAALPARLIPDPGGKRVLDLCAAPGGKTLQLAALGARVTALDMSERRMERLAGNLSRTGLAAELVVADALAWTPEAPFDAVLLDAPCSATGTIRRHPDLPHRAPGRKGGIDLAALTGLQARLLDRAAGWVAPGGVLVFCTCSLIRSEGEGQAAAFLKRHADFARLPVAPGEAGIPPAFLTPEGDLRTRPDFWPDLGGLDGFFAARFRRG